VCSQSTSWASRLDEPELAVSDHLIPELTEREFPLQLASRDLSQYGIFTGEALPRIVRSALSVRVFARLSFDYSAAGGFENVSQNHQA
jgi:hypothetical protein